MQKGFAVWWMLIGFALTVAVASSAYYLVKIVIPKPNPQELSVETKTIPTLSPSPPADEVSTWKAYISQKYNLTFKYPPNGQVEEGLTQPPIRVVSNNSPPYFIFSVDIQDNPDDLSSLQAVEKMAENIRNNPYLPGPGAKNQADKIIQTLKEYKNGQINGIRLMSFFEGYEQGFGRVVYATKNNIYIFSIHDGSGNVTDIEEKLLDQVITTLKFLE